LSEGRVKTNPITKEITFNQKDGRAILEDLLKYEFSDSIMFQQASINGLSLTVINDLRDINTRLNLKNANLETQNTNLTTVTVNQEEEIEFMRDTSKQQEKVIRKHKRSKTFIIIAGVATVVALLLVSK
tara:strand:+ start:89910 stop:90296 length:387 start_codon:yes stop_codon:yes gene_type:complete